MTIRMTVAACLLVASAMPTWAKPPTDVERLRDEGQHLCYDDVQKLCNDAIPDEDKIKACMKVHHAQLSAPCAKVYDEGVGG